MLVRKVENFEEVEAYLRDEKDEFFTNLIMCIKRGWEEKLKSVDVAKFHINETETIFDISINEEDWHETLYLALYHYEGTEQYEYCSEVNSLISDMYGE